MSYKEEITIVKSKKESSISNDPVEKKIFDEKDELQRLKFSWRVTEHLPKKI